MLVLFFCFVLECVQVEFYPRMCSGMITLPRVLALECVNVVITCAQSHF